MSEFWATMLLQQEIGECSVSDIKNFRNWCKLKKAENIDIKITHLKDLDLDPYRLALIDEVLKISDPYYICKTMVLSPHAISITLKLDTPQNSFFSAVVVTSKTIGFDGYEGSISDPDIFKGIKALMHNTYERESGL